MCRALRLPNSPQFGTTLARESPIHSGAKSLGSGAGPGRIWKDVEIREWERLHEPDRLGMICRRLSGKSGNHVGTEREDRKAVGQPSDGGSV